MDKLEKSSNDFCILEKVDQCQQFQGQTDLNLYNVSFNLDKTDRRIKKLIHEETFIEHICTIGGKSISAILLDKDKKAVL